MARDIQVDLRPRWPLGEIAPERYRVRFGLPADELVVRFPDSPGGGVSDLIEAPAVDGVAVLVDDETNTVVGLHVYPFLASAAQVRPAWRALAAPDPASEVVARFVAEVRDLFERYWTPAPPIAEQLAGRAAERGGATGA